MVDRAYVESQLNKIGFGKGRVNRAEILELEHILMSDEIIYECVNGYYEGGIALLVATDNRVLLIDKKPMGFLNVDDVRFDMISDLDYSHRVFGAQININCGMRNLIFKSYNQARLRKAIGHIQQRISEIKREQSDHAVTQKQHLEDINKQLQMYLLSQQQQLQRQLSSDESSSDQIRPSPQLADYLFAQRLLEDFQSRSGAITSFPDNKSEAVPGDSKNETTQASPIAKSDPPSLDKERKLLDEIAEAGRLEVFGGADKESHSIVSPASPPLPDSYGLDITPFKIAYAKLPYLLRSRRYRNPIT